MATILHVAGQFEIPLNVQSLDAFRQWAFSPEYPESGRFDFLAGRIEVDMSPEELFTHGRPKVRLLHALEEVVDRADLGYILSDKTRVTCTESRLSAEPDIVFVSHNSLDAGRARIISSPKQDDRYIEIQGAPDLIVEIVSDSSVSKDTRDLPPLYFAAGVVEYWLVDARGEDQQFLIHRRGTTAFELVERDGDGFQRSSVFDRTVRLSRSRDRRGYWRYDLECQPG